MPEIGTSGSMSGDGKRSAGLRAQATAPILDSTIASVSPQRINSGAIGGIADMPRRPGARPGDANDPQATKAGQFCYDA
jgi:hypothetical protein